jgi:regulatory protein
MPLRPGGVRRQRGDGAAPLDAEAAEAQAQRLLAAGERSRSELRLRLLRAGAEPEVAAQVVARLASRGWVDDARVAESLVRRSLERGYGSRRLLADLRARGVDREEVEGAMRQVAERQEEAVRRAAQRLLGHRPPGPLDPAEARRLAAALLRRGFSSGEVREAVRRVAQGDDAVDASPEVVP